MITTPKEATEFRKACSVFRKHITPNSQTRREFEEIVQVVVLDALEGMKVE